MLEAIIHDNQIYILKLLSDTLNALSTALTDDNRHIWELAFNLQWLIAHLIIVVKWVNNFVSLSFAFISAREHCHCVFFREMGDIRKEWESVLTHGYYRVLYAHRGQLVLSREAECGSLVLCLNAEEAPFTYPCDGIYTDVRNNQTVSEEVDVPSLDFRILYQKALA